MKLSLKCKGNKFVSWYHSIVNTLILILSSFGSQFHNYHLLCCKRVGRQSIRHPLNSDIGRYEALSCLPVCGRFECCWSHWIPSYNSRDISTFPTGKYFLLGGRTSAEISTIVCSLSST